MVIQKIDSDIEKKEIARAILEALPDWFGIPEAMEAYIADSKGRPFFCAFADDVPVGFLYLKETGRLWDSRNWKCSQRCGTNGIPARFI